MERQPRSASEGIFDGGVGIEIALQGALVSLLTLSAYFIGGYMETGVFSLGESADGMTMAFLTMAMAEIFHSCNMRSRHSSIFRLHTGNPALFGAVIASLALTAVSYTHLAGGYNFRFYIRLQTAHACELPMHSVC